MSTLLIAPFLVMPVASALLWKHAIYNPDYGLLNGTLNAVYRFFGAANGPTVDWVSSFPMPAVVISLVWQWTPFMMLILLAGLQAQPGDVLEAARVDGASALATFRYVDAAAYGKTWAGPQEHPDHRRANLAPRQAALRPSARRDLVLAALWRGPGRMRAPRWTEH